METVAAMLPYCAQGNPSRRRRAGCPGRMRPKAAGRSKLGDGAQASGRQNRAHAVAFVDHRARAQRGGDFAHVTGNRRANHPPLHLITQTLDAGGDRRAVAFQLADLALEVFQLRAAVAFARAQVALDAVGLELQAVGGMPQSLRLHLADVVFAPRHQAFGGQLLQTMRLVIGGAGQGVSFAVFRPRLLDGDLCRLLLARPRLLQLRDLRLQRTDLRFERPQLRALFRHLQPFRVGVQFHEHVAGLHFLAEHQVA